MDSYKKYKANVQDLVAPTGSLLASGFVREFNHGIPDEIGLVCSQFLDLYLEFECPSAIDKDAQSFKLMDYKQWAAMNEFDKRLLRDRLVFDTDTDIRSIDCEIFGHGRNEIDWLLPVLKNSQNLCYVNMSNCYLNDNAVQNVCEALKQNQSNGLKWLDISDNQCVTDASMRHLLSIMHQLEGFNLNCTSVTDVCCVMLGEYLKQNKHMLRTLKVIKLDGNLGITERGKQALQPFISDTCTVVFD